MYYECVTLISGIVCKLYYDIADNKNFNNYKKNKIFMEILKGLHFITFTTISIDYPLFFYLTVVVHIIQYIMDKGAFYKPYEKSVLYSFSILFLLLDYKKINISFNLSDVSFYIVFSCICIVENLLIYKEEICLNKLLLRIVGIIYILFHLLFVKYNDKTIICLIFYAIGYLLVSIMVQYYSLFIVPKNKLSNKIKIEKKIKKEKKIKNKEKN